MRALIKPVFLLLLVSSPVFSQIFVTIDADTQELIENVSYSLFKDDNVVYKGVTLIDKPTSIDKGVDFDSISFSRIDYKTLGLAKSNIDSVLYLSKDIIYLDEVVVGSQKDNEVVLGETNRFVRRRSAVLNKELVYGLVFSNGSPQQLQLDKMAFYVDKVKLKTAYRIIFSDVSEVYTDEGHHFAEPGELLHETDILYLSPKDKGRVEVVLPNNFYFPAAKKMFVWIQLLEYYDEKGMAVTPEQDKQTKVKFQLSDKLEYYSRMYDLSTKKYTDGIVNTNRMLNYDFATLFYNTPKKSDLVTPAILLYAHKSKDVLKN